MISLSGRVKRLERKYNATDRRHDERMAEAFQGLLNPVIPIQDVLDGIQRVRDEREG